MPNLIRKLANPCGRADLRTDLASWADDIRCVLSEMYGRIILREPKNPRDAVAPDGSPIYRRRTLRNPMGWA